MSRLEKLKSIRDAFSPLVKNQKDWCDLDDAMLRLQELIEEEEIKDTLIRNPSKIAIPFTSRSTLFVDESTLCSMSDVQRADFWKAQHVRFGEKVKEKDVFEAARKLREEIIKNAAKDSSPFETFRTIYNTISSQNSAKEKSMKARGEHV